MTAADHIVFAVDDDFRIREALKQLLSSAGMNAVTFGTAAEYMAFEKPDLAACLILDLELPDINGLELQARIAAEPHPPIVFITGYGDIPTTVRALKAGAIDFLTKPFSDAQLLATVSAGIAQDRAARAKRNELVQVQRRYSALTPREQQVMSLVVSGFLNKQAAAQLGISEITLQIHRRRIKRKMGADSFADLVRMAGALGIPITSARRASK